MANMIFPLITEYELKLPYYIVGVGCHHNQEHIKRPKGYPHYQWIQCHHGRGTIMVEGTSYPVGEGQGILLFPHTPHEYYAVSDRWEVDWIILGGRQMDDFFQATAGIQSSGVYFLSQPDSILSRIRQALVVEQSDNPIKSLECSRLAYDILVDILVSSSLKSDYSRDRQYNRIKPLIDFLDKHYSASLTLKELSEVVGVSPQYLCVLFKKVTGLRVFEYINFVRIKKSKEYILQDRDMPIKEVARLSGYDDVSYFCALFKRIEAVSPAAFRRLHIFGNPRRE